MWTLYSYCRPIITGMCYITFFLENMYMFQHEFYFLLKTVIYNIIEQHDNKEMALLTTNILIGRRMRRIADVASQVCSLHFSSLNLKNLPPPQAKCQEAPVARFPRIPINMSAIHVYVQTAESKEEEINNFYKKKQFWRYQ